MRRLSYKLLFLTFIETLFLLTGARSQTKVEVGKPMPEYIFTDVEYFEHKTISTTNTTGKWLIIDYWGEFCSACIKSFPKMNDLQKKFNSEIQIVLIGTIYKEKRAIRSLFERCRLEKSLNLPIAYDSVSSKKFNVIYNPDIIIIDPNGVVRGRVPNLTEENINSLLKGENISDLYSESIAINSNWEKYNVDYVRNKVDSPTNSNLLLSSSLEKYNASIPPSLTDQKGKFEIIRADLSTLYKLAYIGTRIIRSSEKAYHSVSNKTILNTKDSIKFTKFDTSQMYSLNISYNILNKCKHVEFKSNRWLQNILKNQLAASFPYQASLTPIRQKCYYLKISRRKRRELKAKGFNYAQKDSFESIRTFTSDTCTIESLISRITSDETLPESFPIFNKTKIDFPFRVKINSIYREDLEEQLKKFGFRFKEKKKKLKTLIIDDPTSSYNSNSH